MPLVPPRTLLIQVLRAVTAIGAAYATLHWLIPALFGVDLIAALNRALASASEALLRTAGFPVERVATTLTLRGASVVVTDDCNSVGAWLLVTGAIAAFPGATWPRRVAGIAAAAAALSLVNVVRIAILCYLRAEQPGWFGPVHEQLFPLVVVLVAALTVAAWRARVEQVYER